MALLPTILEELKKPDDQNRDWYGWVVNQCAHAFLGVIAAKLFPAAPIEMAFIISALKELGDFIRVPSFRTARDSANDIFFAVVGAWVLTAVGLQLYLALAVMIGALLLGVAPRVRKVLREVKNGNDHQ